MADPPATESELRADLGIPGDARRVLIVVESSHWDPNWMLTSTQYYRLLVRRTLDRVIDELLEEPRRVFSLESVFFPDMYLEDRPERRELFTTLVNEGRLRFSGCGVTTPDTLLPAEEMILRDLLIGQEWMRRRGMVVEPDVLYLPDSFGHSPGLPSILSAAGIGAVAFHRIDGMYFPGGETDPRSEFPRVGSSAELLRNRGSSDFVWRSDDGSEVLAHWLEHGYGHGDMIGSRGFTRTLQLPLSWPSRGTDRVAGRIRGYVEQLAPTARTPYLLLALGHDFVAPVPGLVALLDAWNERYYDSTGVWLLNTSLDRYFALVSHHRDVLPIIEFDPNPCWTGFYSSRPTLKSTARRLQSLLLTADHSRAVDLIDRRRGDRRPGSEGAPGPTGGTRSNDGLDLAWWIGALSNHHDFITGTSNDRVALGEQMGMLERATRLVIPEADGHPAATPADRSGPRREPRGVDPPGPTPGASSRRARPRTAVPDPAVGTWTRTGSVTTVALGWATASFDEELGGALVDLTAADGGALITGPALGLHSLRDSGGLWRMGCEFRGGRWSPAGTDTASPARLSLRALGRPGGTGAAPHAVVVDIDTTLERRPATIRVTLPVAEPLMVVETILSVPNGRTVTLGVPGPHPVGRLEMHQPGGLVQRPTTRCFDPTFWPLHSFAHLLTDPGPSVEPTSRMSIAAAAPTGVHVDPSGLVEVVVARSAVKERAHGVIPILAPVWGRRWGAQRSTVAFGWNTPGSDDTSDWSKGGEHTPERLPPGAALHATVSAIAGVASPQWAVRTDDPAVETVSVKPADRGGGTIVRLRNWAYRSDRRPGHTIALRTDPALDATVTRAWLTDARERDIAPLEVDGGVVQVPLGGHLTTVRLEY